MTAARLTGLILLVITSSAGCTKADFGTDSGSGGSGGDMLPDSGSGGAPGTGGGDGEGAFDAPVGDDADAMSMDVPGDLQQDLGGPDQAKDLGNNVDGGSDGDGMASDGADDGPPGVMPTTSGQILVSELMANSAALADDLGEWVEVYNPSPDVTYDLNGCLLSDHAMPTPHTTPIAGSFIMRPGTYHTIARSSVAFTPDFIQTSIKFDNTGADGAMIVCNSVTIAAFAYQPGQPVEGHPFSVDPSHLKPDEYTLPGNWCVSNVPLYTTGSVSDFGTPGKANPPCPAGKF